MFNLNTDQKSLETKTQGLPKDIGRRLTRLVIAVYRVTDYFDEKEPIKYAMRNVGVDLLRGSVSFIPQNKFVAPNTIRDIKDSLNTLYVQCSVLEHANIVSEVNSKLLKDEILSLTELVENSGPRANLMVDIASLDQSLIARTVSEGSAPRSVKSEVRSDLSFGDRKTAIIDYLRLRGSASIKDLSGIVKGCSEKTIQRELGALINMNVVRKEGDKRWSRYLIANNAPL